MKTYDWTVRRWIAWIAPLTLLTLGLATPAKAQPADNRWQQADALEQQGRFLEAADAYAAILANEPDSQRAAVKRAMAQFHDGGLPEALQSIDASIQMNPFNRVWAEWGYLYKAKTCQSLGCVQDAREAIAILKARFPDSISTARAEVIEAQFDGLDPAAAEAAVEVELAAEKIHEAATAASKAGDSEGALLLLDQVIQQYPATRKSLRSMEIKALMLAGLPDRGPEAMTAFEEVLARVKESAPHSRLRYEAEYRIAALQHRAGNKQDAMQRYTRLANLAQDPNVVSAASVQAAGLRFELLQQAPAKATDADWEQVRAECRQVAQLAVASPMELAIAELMILETYHWQGQDDQTVKLADEFLAKHTDAQYRRQRGTAHMFAGLSHQRMKNYSEALTHFRWIVVELQHGPIWPAAIQQMETYTHYSVFTVLRRSGAPQEQVIEAGMYVLDHYPDTAHARIIRAIAEKEGWPNVN